MNNTDRQKFAQLLTDVLSFYGQSVSSFALDVWWGACNGFEFDAVSRALSRHAMDPERGMFAPKPADVVRQLQGTNTDRAAQAWGLTLDAMSRVGAYSDVVFDDPIIHCVVEDLGGWPMLCRTETANLSYTQHRFSESYRAYAAKDDRIGWPSRLKGDRSSDESYLQRGLNPPRPVLIGNQERAARVLVGGSSEWRSLTHTTGISLALESALARIGHDAKDAAA